MAIPIPGLDGSFSRILSPASVIVDGDGSTFASQVCIITLGNIASSLATSSSKWIIDSGATDHMIGSHNEASSWQGLRIWWPLLR
ncbi:hypothetical protein K1719_000565 [Acacia pycnantha]|nr:hypothetical protein K1719_000565 [Acacia pycnantha]